MARISKVGTQLACNKAWRFFGAWPAKPKAGMVIATVEVEQIFFAMSCTTRKNCGTMQVMYWKGA